MSDSSITITLRLPDDALHQNSRKHRMSVARATKVYRQLAACEAVAASGGLRHGWNPAQLGIAFYFPDAIRRDLLNYAGACKAAIDGIVDAGIIADDDWKCLRFGAIEASVDRDAPRVEITVSEAR